MLKPSFSFLKWWHTYAHRHPYRGSTHKSLKKQSDFAKKNIFFGGFISKVKVTCMPNFCLIFWVFILNAIFYSSFTHGIHSHHNRGSKWTRKSPKSHCFLLRIVSFKAFLCWKKSLVHANCLFYILFMVNAFFFSSYVVAYLDT